MTYLTSRCFRILASGFLVLAVLAPALSYSDGDRRDASSDERFERSEDRRGGNRDSDRGRTRSRAPRAKLRVKLSDQVEEGFEWVRLDARKSKSRQGRVDAFHFTVRNRITGRLIPGPGELGESVASVRLPPGDYEAELRVRDVEGRSDVRRRKFRVDGPRVASAPQRSIQWSFGRAAGRKRTPISFNRTPGPIPLGIVEALFGRGEGATLLGKSGEGCGGFLSSAGNGIAVATGVLGVGLTFAAPEYKVAAQGASRSLDVDYIGGTGMQIAGGNASGACVQAQIDTINDQLKFQESQITDLYNDLYKTKDAFFKALTAINTTVDNVERSNYGQTIDLISSLLTQFMIAGALWNGEDDKPWVGSTSPAVLTGVEGDTDLSCAGDIYYGKRYKNSLAPTPATPGDGNPASFDDMTAASSPYYKISASPSFNCTNEYFGDPAPGFYKQCYCKERDSPLPLDLLSIASCDLSSQACCVGAVKVGCSIATTTGGPMDALTNIVPADLGENLMDATGSTLDASDCSYDCWKNVRALEASSKPKSELLFGYESMSKQFFEAVKVCTNEDPTVRAECLRVDGDVVPLFDTYNDAIGSIYMQSLVALQQAYSMEQLVNLYNYNRYLGSLCSRGLVADVMASDACKSLKGGDLGLESIPSFGRVGGTHYQWDMLRGCGGGRGPLLPREHANAFNCAQKQLALVYIQRANILYRHVLNYTFTDAPAGSQAYPTTTIQFPPGPLATALAAWNMRTNGTALGPRLDYEEEIGRALPIAVRTPIKLFTNNHGLQTAAANGYNWTEDGVIYQAYQIADAAACINTLLAFQASGAADTSIENVYSSYEDCPSIFALPDTAGVIWGFYDGITLQTYSSHQPAGGGTVCLDVCKVCDDGLDATPYSPGGQGLVPRDGEPTCSGYCSSDNVCGDYRFADMGYTDCTGCFASVQPAPDWNSFDGTNGSWSETCPEATAVFSGNDSNPTLQASCFASNQSLIANKPTSCGDGLWGNDNGILFCEGTAAGPSNGFLSLSAKMGGNVRQCASTFSDDPILRSGTSPAVLTGVEGDTDLSCAGDIYFGKRFENSLDDNLVTPGSGREATFAEMIEEPSYHISVASSSFDCTNEYFGVDPAPGFLKQCYCATGNQLTWYRPPNVPGNLLEGVPYLTCGNYKDPNTPRLPWEYMDPGGNQYDQDNDEPPTIFRNVLSTSTQSKESDIGIASTDPTVNMGHFYEVAFANISSACNTQDNIQLNFEFSNGSTYVASPDPSALTANSSDHWASGGYPEFQFDLLRQNDDEKSGFVSFIIGIPNLDPASISPGPKIPVDVVMQCTDSDDSDVTCNTGDTCMYLATFQDQDMDSLPSRAEVLAKRGYICEATHNTASATSDGSPGGSYADISCELSDGRGVSVRLRDSRGNRIGDRQARIEVSVSEN